MLRLPIEQAYDVIDERIAKGNALLPTQDPVGSREALDHRRADYYTWNDYNKEWIKKFIGVSIGREYEGSGVGFISLRPTSLQEDVEELRQDIEMKLRRLGSIRERLPIWVEAEVESRSAAIPSPSRGPSMGPDGKIFVVHGAAIGRAHEVARVVERATGRDVIILHEQPNQGRTLLEKFEETARDAAFAVVVLTADDEGRRRVGHDGAGVSQEAPLAPRGRQNVIFELGFFFAHLGRQRVVVLLDKDVEQPSDISGLVYELLDSAGAWKQRLAKELRTAGIEVNEARIP